MYEKLLERIKQYTNNLEDKENSYYYTTQEGPRFIKIVRKDKGNSNSGSAHAFVEKETGKLAKSASWNSPAKKKNGELQSKYNLLDDDSFELLLKQSNKYGGHLYVR